MKHYNSDIWIIICLVGCVLVSCRHPNIDKELELYSCQSKQFVERNRLDSAVLANLRIIDLIDTLDSRYIPVLVRTYNDLGDLFYNVAVFERSLAMYRKALHFSDTLSDKSEESRARRGIWRCCAAGGKTDGDSVIVQALRLFDNITSVREVASLCNNLAGYYQYKGDYANAFLYNEKAILLCTDSVNQFRNYNVRSELFLITDVYDSAWFYARRASQSPNIYTKAGATLRLSKVAEILKPDSATFYLKHYCAVMDSIQNLRQSDSIQAALNRKQILSIQAEGEQEKALLTVVFCIVGVLILVLLVVFWIRLCRENQRYKELRCQADNLRLLNDKLCANKKMLENNQPLQYSDQYRELLDKERYMERTFIEQLVSARSCCVTTFKRRSLFRKLPLLIEEGGGVLKMSDREKLRETVQADFALLFHPLSTFLKMSSDDFFLYCLTISGLSTKECAACRGLTESAIRMQRKRLNDRIRSFFLDSSLLDDILL